MKCENNNQVFNRTTLFEIIKKQKPFLILFPILVTLVAVIYRYQLVTEYDKKPLYKGSLHVKMGNATYTSSINEENYLLINKYKLGKGVTKKNNNYIITFIHPSNSNELFISIIQYDKISIDDNLNKALELLNEVELKIYTDMANEYDHKPKLNSVTYSHPIKKINIQKQNYPLNYYFILCTFLLGFIISTILSVFLNKID